MKVVDRVITRSEQLSELPNSGRQVPEYQRSDVRELLEKPYRITYKIKSNQMDVLTVMHYRQVFPGDMKAL